MRRLTLTTISAAALILIAAAYSSAAKNPKSSGISQPFVTLPLKPNSLRFAVIGDSGSGDTAETQIAQQMAAIRVQVKFDFVLTVGDNLYGGSSPSDYELRFSKPFKPLLDQGVKFYAALGNHDNTNEISYAPFNMNGNRYYTFQKGEAQFFVLDSNYFDSPQIEWLKNELKTSTASWKIAYFHHPLYSSGKRHGSDIDLRTVLEPILQTYRVNIVLQGHDHIYERIRAQGGIVYFVIGSSGQLRTGGIATNGIKAAGFDSDQCFMLAEIAGDEFYFQAISRAGDTVDSGVFKRSSGTSTADSQ